MFSRYRLCAIDAIDGYTSEMMRVHRRMLELRQLELELAVQLHSAPKKRGRKRIKRSESPVRASSKNSKYEGKYPHIKMCIQILL